MSKKTQEDLKKKFTCAYWIAKSELPIVKYESLLGLEKKLEVPLENAYQNRNTAASFLETIAYLLGKRIVYINRLNKMLKRLEL